MFRRTDQSGRARLRRSAAVLSALTLGAMVSAVAPAQATTVVATQRFGGTDRYDTAAKIAAAKFPTGVQSAVLTTGENFPDALSGSYLAGVQGAAILLTAPGALPAATTAALSALKVKNVTILGGIDAVSAAVATALGATASTNASGGNLVVTRIGGTNRYDTARLVNTTPPASGIGIVGGKRTAIVATGGDFPDAMAASAGAYARSLPIVLTDTGTLSPEASATLTALSIGHVLIMGGTGAVSAGVETAINNAGFPTLQRFSGTDRMDTAAKFAAYAVANLMGFTNTEVGLARGDLFPDALAASSYGVTPKPILLTQNPTTLSGPTTNYLTVNCAVVAQVTAFGGTEAVANATLDAAKTAAQVCGTGLPGGGGGGGGGTTVPANPTTAGPNLRSTSVVTNGFAQGQPSTVRFTFDKGIAFPGLVPLATRLIGTATNAGSASPAPMACVVNPDGLSSDCQFPATVNVAAFTLGTVDSGAVLASAGGFPNVLNTAPLAGSIITPFAGPLLVNAVVDAAGNQVTYTFNQNVVLPVLGAGVLQALFGAPATATVNPPVDNRVTVSYPSTSSAAVARLRAGAVLGRTSLIPSPDMALNSSGWVVSIARTTAPNQFLFTVDRPSVLAGPTRFAVYLNSNGAEILSTGVSQVSPTEFLATFPGITNTNTDDVALGAIKGSQAAPLPVATAGVTQTAVPTTTANPIGSRFISGATTALANGPILQSASGSLGTSQVVYTFDRNIAIGSVVFGSFFVVSNTGVATAGTGTVGVSGNQVVIVFPPGSLSTMVGAGLVSPLGSQLPIGAVTAATDSAGNQNVPGTVAATAT